MPDLQKLKVILLERHQEPVHLFLAKMGGVQYIKVDCEEESYNGFLHACSIPKEESLMNLEIQTRILRDFEEMHIKPKNKIGEVALPPGNTIKEILVNVEHRLEEIEDESNSITDLLELSSSLIKKTGQKLHNWKATHKKLNSIYKPSARQHASEELLSEANPHLIDISNQLEETDREVLELQRNEYSDEYSLKEIPEIGEIQTKLLDLHGMTLKIDNLLEAEHDMAHCESIVYFKAWVLNKQIFKAKEGIKKITNGKCVIEVEKPKSNDNVPNVINRKKRLFEGFEILTYSLGFPRKGEINPVYLMAFAFPFLYGIMFADVGHGAILFLGGLLLLIARNRKNMNKVGEIPRYVLLSAGIITLSGISAMFWGYLFGEFFGPSGVLHPVLLVQIGPFYLGGFDPVHEPLRLLRFTILIGVSFITFSLLFRVINHLKRRERARAIAAICWIWFILGGFFMWVYWGGISQITAWFGEGLPMLLALVMAPLIVSMIIMARAENIMEGVNFSVEVFIESLGHTLSFCRLAALFLAHTALSTMFLDLAGVKNGNFPPSSIPLIAIGTVLILCIEGLIVAVHTLRLHWIELLPKFYSAKGTLFQPIKIK
ncbi:MAG: V-type ATPase 116kDa subunit family protein [Promethearchaeota archaeon]|jgi:V/A-type H+-transporting ATPase subunit I